MQVALTIAELERSETIHEQHITELFLNIFRQHQGKSLPGISKAALDLMMAHNWPGNVRELRNLLEYATIVTNGDLIQPEHLRLQQTGTSQGKSSTGRIRTINLPQSYEALGLPAGLNIDTLTGVISGRPLNQGTFAVVIKATNTYGTDVAELSMRITASATQ